MLDQMENTPIRANINLHAVAWGGRSFPGLLVTLMIFSCYKNMILLNPFILRTRMDTEIFNTAGSAASMDASYTHSKSKHVTVHAKETSTYNECIWKYNGILLPFLLSTTWNSWKIQQYFKITIILI